MAKEVTPTTALLNEEQLSGMKTIDDVLAVFAQAGVEVTSISDYGDGFAVMDKSAFVNKKMVLVDYKIVPGEKSDYGTDFAVIRVLTAEGTKGIITDGSTGIRDQILTLQRKGVMGGVMCEKGLVVSEYTYDEVDKASGEITKKPAKTYYFAGM